MPGETKTARPSAWLSWTSEGGPEETRPLATFTFLGRSPLNTVPIPDPEVSLGHALIVRTAAGALLIDLGSRNGLRVNGERVDRRILGDGDRIAIGRRTLRFHAEPDLVPTPDEAEVDPVEELVRQAAQKLATRSSEDLARISPSLRRTRRDTVCRPLAAPTARLTALDVA